jgi:hypothetical protein
MWGRSRPDRELSASYKCVYSVNYILIVGPSILQYHYKMTNRCLMSYSSNVFAWAYTDYDPSSVASCHGFHQWPHWTGIRPHKDIAWVAYKAPTTPWRWQPLAERGRGKIWNTLIKSNSSLTHLLVILRRSVHYSLLNSICLMSASKCTKST